jgi:hypothetical protein
VLAAMVLVVLDAAIVNVALPTIGRARPFGAASAPCSTSSVRRSAQTTFATPGMSQLETDML